MPRPLLIGIVNITADSFSDGGRYLDPGAAMVHARALAAGGADIVELGAAASNVAAGAVSPRQEIERLEPVIAGLRDLGKLLAVDTCQSEVQRFAVGRGVAYLNDITGFPDAAIYPELAASSARLIVMHAIQEESRAQRRDLAAEEVWERINAFFAARIAALEAAGVSRDRLILDPGMGFFLSSRAEASLRVLTGIAELKREHRLPVLISVSRKSFLGAVIGRGDPLARGPATLAAELYAARAGADYIRTHDPAALRDALLVSVALDGMAARYSNA
ncbi:MAG: dihydropteroate synthase [Alphaproteobacteria bacterium]|nr:dihydropteroate synthase [Alphaproteobacteria bacterium]